MRIQQSKGAIVVLVQDTGSSKLSYELKKYEGFVASPSMIGAIVGGVVGALVLIGLGVSFYKRHKAQKLAHELGNQSLI